MSPAATEKTWRQELLGSMRLLFTIISSPVCLDGLPLPRSLPKRLAHEEENLALLESSLISMPGKSGIWIRPKNRKRERNNQTAE